MNGRCVFGAQYKQEDKEIMLYEEKVIETIPVGPLGLISLKSCTELGNKVDRYLVDWRRERESEHKSTIAFTGYQRDSYIINASTPRFGSGEGKGIIEESVRGDDLYIMVDVCNYSLTYSLFGMTNHMSPDDHFQDLKRIIAAAAGKARRINVIMPFLYESRQHKRRTAPFPVFKPKVKGNGKACHRMSRREGKVLGHRD